MAVFPEGSIPVYNPVGVAPGMILKVKSTTIISLPGVPSEMRGIVSQSLTGFWKEFFSGVVFVKRNIIIRGIPEADLVQYVRKVQAVDPDIYIKSRIKIRGKLDGEASTQTPANLPWVLLLHFSMVAGSKAEGTRRIDRLIDLLVADLDKRYRLPFLIDGRSDR